jgi:hypothetical protein
VQLDVHDLGFWSEVAFGGDVGAARRSSPGLDGEDLVRLLRLFVRDRDVLLDVDGGCGRCRSACCCGSDNGCARTAAPAASATSPTTTTSATTCSRTSSTRR